MKPTVFLLLIFSQLPFLSLRAQNQTRESRIAARITWLKGIFYSKGFKVENADLLYNVAGMYALKGDTDSAFYYLFKATRICPDSEQKCIEVYNTDVLGDVSYKWMHKDSRWKEFEKIVKTGFYKINTNITHPDLAYQLLLAKGYDQSSRFCYGFLDEKQKSEVLRLNIDSVNLDFIKKVMRQYGFPTVPMVGASASHAAFLLIQHADKDLSFQKKVLALMKASENSVKKENIAYLTDRIMVAEEGKQLYGTQFISLKDRKLYPIVDSAGVDERRKKMGMSALNRYLDSFYIPGE